MRIVPLLGDVGTHRCGMSPQRCMAWGLRVPLDCCWEHVGLYPGRRPCEQHPARVRRKGAGHGGAVRAGRGVGHREGAGHGMHPAMQQVAGQHAGRGRRLGRPDAWPGPPGRPARPAHPPARDEPRPDRGRPLDPDRHLLRPRNTTSPTATSDPTGSPDATKLPTPVGSRPSSRSSATPKSSTPPPDPPADKTGRAPPHAFTRQCPPTKESRVCEDLWLDLQMLQLVLGRRATLTCRPL